MPECDTDKIRIVCLFAVLGLVQITILFFPVNNQQSFIPHNETLVHFGNHSVIEAIWHTIISDDSGRFRVRFTPNVGRNQDHGYPVLRIRVVGPQIKLLTPIPSFKSTGEDWIAYYNIECAGRYSVEILPLYEAFYKDDLAKGKLLPQWPPFVPLQYIDVMASSSTCQLGDQWKTRPNCSALLMKYGGSWVIDDKPGGYDGESWDPDQIMSFLSRSKIHSDPRFIPEHVFEQLRPMSVVENWNETDVPWFLLEKHFARLQYRYFACQPEDSQELIKRCMRPTDKRSVCLFGDSQTRTLYNSIVELLEPDNQDCKTAAQKTVCETSLPLRYIADKYGDVGVGSAPSCRIMLINFGQWPISWVETVPYSVSRYQNMVKTELTRFSDITSSHVFWLSTNSMPMNGRVLGGIDWRIDPVFDLYNNAANQIAEKAGIPTIDIYFISTVLNELSTDRAHFKDPVGRALAYQTLTTICDPTYISNT